MADEPEIHLLDIIVALLLLTGKARIVATVLNRETDRFTLNAGSELFVWKSPAPAAPTAKSAAAEQPATGCPYIRCGKPDNSCRRPSSRHSPHPSAS